MLPGNLQRVCGAVLGLAVIAGCRANASPVVIPNTPDKLQVHPAQITLSSRRDCRQLVVTGWFHGEPRDLTHTAVLSPSASAVVSVKGGMVRAAADGDGVITVSAGSRSVRVPVHVLNARKPDPVRFKFETLAVLTRQGCSTGSCHGAPHGKGGFVLSLFGYNPAADRISLTREGFSRRIDVMEPADSLMIKKPMLELPHVGGKRLRRGDDAYSVLYNWIAEGATADLPEVECTGISVYPNAEKTLRPGCETQQMAVLANFSDGTVKDVTRLAAFSSSSAGSISVDPQGLVSGRSRGQAAITVRYLDKVSSVHFLMVEPQKGFVWTRRDEANEIDQLVDARLKQLEYLPSPTCSDSTFVRRVYLDITGLLPTADQSRTFLQDTSASKRARLIDLLLDTEEYARFWALKRADLMRVSPAHLKGDRAAKFSQWIVESIRSNQPYDRFARDLITSSGDTEKSPAACYYVAISTMEDRTEMTAEIFMGSRVECARCHNHPFENWTMRDYYSIGAVFARTKSDGAVVSLAKTGETANPNSGETMAPFGSSGTQQARDGDRRVAFADWLVRPGNPLFARVAANRIWSAVMGRGIVEPVDDFRSSNPPSNGPLLDWLAARFEKSGYDCKSLIRLICNSATYQRSSETNTSNGSDETLFSHAKLRMLSAEQVKDAIGAVTHALPPVATAREKYATEAAYPEVSAFTAAFGQPDRSSACTCERQSGPTLIQALELLNGPTAYAMADAAPGYYGAMDDGKLIDELYLAALSRLPLASEKVISQKYLKNAANRTAAVTDVAWTIVNMREFLFQH